MSLRVGARPGTGIRWEGTCMRTLVTALACDGRHGPREVEDWQHTYTPMMDAMQIGGVVTSDTGEIFLRLYDGEEDTRKFIGVETAYIRGHTFRAIRLQVARPAGLSIKYSIRPE